MTSAQAIWPEQIIMRILSRPHLLCRTLVRQLHLVEIYADGKLTKRMRRADQKRERVHWRIVAAPQPNPEAAPDSSAAEQPPPLHGHAMARVGSAIFMYGGVTHTADGKEVFGYISP